MMSSVGRYERVNSKTYDKARKEYSEQVKLQMANKPNVPAFTEEHRQKLSLAKRGKKLSEETKEKLRLSRLGSKASEETKRKISESKKGIATRGSGWKHSEETKMKMKQTQAYLAWLDEGNTPEPSDE